MNYLHIYFWFIFFVLKKLAPLFFLIHLCNLVLFFKIKIKKNKSSPETDSILFLPRNISWSIVFYCVGTCGFFSSNRLWLCFFMRNLMMCKLKHVLNPRLFLPCSVITFDYRVSIKHNLFLKKKHVFKKTSSFELCWQITKMVQKYTSANCKK